MNYNELKPGRELDELVAEKVMGWTRNESNLLVPPIGTPMRDHHWAALWDENGLPHWLPNFSTDISAAWQIVKQILETKGLRFTLDNTNCLKDNFMYEACFYMDGPGNEDFRFYDFKTEDAAHAICIAALKSYIK